MITNVQKGQTEVQRIIRKINDTNYTINGSNENKSALNEDLRITYGQMNQNKKHKSYQIGGDINLKP